MHLYTEASKSRPDNTTYMSNVKGVAILAVAGTAGGSSMLYVAEVFQQM